MSPVFYCTSQRASDCSCAEFLLCSPFYSIGVCVYILAISCRISWNQVWWSLYNYFCSGLFCLSLALCAFHIIVFFCVSFLSSFPLPLSLTTLILCKIHTSYLLLWDLSDSFLRVNFRLNIWRKKINGKYFILWCWGWDTGLCTWQVDTFITELQSQL